MGIYMLFPSAYFYPVHLFNEDIFSFHPVESGWLRKSMPHSLGGLARFVTWTVSNASQTSPGLGAYGMLYQLDIFNL